MKTAGDYLNGCYDFEEFDCIGGSNPMVVFPQLTGKPFDDLAVGLLHALRPSCIRIIRDTMKLDARVWRVNVHIDENNLIKSIDQEVQIGIPGANDEDWDKNHDILNDLMWNEVDDSV